VKKAPVAKGRSRSTAMSTIDVNSPVARAARHAQEPVSRYRVSANTKAAMSEVGFSGLRLSGGRLNEEWHPELRGTLAIKIWKEMRDNDPIVGALLFAVTMLIRQARWTIKPFDDSVESTKHVDFVRSCMDDMRETWNDFLTDMLSMLPFGWSLHEEVYKKRNGFTQPGDENSSKHADGLIGWKSLALRPQDTLNSWVTEPSRGAVIGMEQLTQQGQRAVIPLSRSLIFRPTSWKNSPEGRSILRTAYRPWKFKKRYEELEGVGIERDLAGLPVITPGEGVNIWDPDNPLMVTMKREAEELVRSVRMDEQMGIVLPFGWTFELLSASGTRAHNVGEVIGRLNNSIAMTCMADFIILGHNNRYGSKALAGNKTQMFQMAIGGFLDGTDEVLNNFALPRLYAVNGMPVDRMCRFEHGDISLPDLEVLGVFLEKLHKAGMTLFPEEKLEKFALELAGISTDGMKLGKEAPKEEGADGSGDDDSEDSGSGSKDNKDPDDSASD
jgi:hypothetical protein